MNRLNVLLLLQESKAINDESLSKVWIWPEKLLQIAILLYSVVDLAASLLYPICVKLEASVNCITAFIALKCCLIRNKQ